ncbi:hypothetical protein LWI29_025708 [Acer saccharum]|uniref:Uncharacterized protein n=1 Tax=Acer saccharum TaxID=4024 RepID=A0AA39RQW7_ACESA|nr:hypothetical protein LWI29_025708 [Acer saccharum]
MFLFSNNNKTQNVSILDCSGLGPVVLDRMYQKNRENESLIRILLWFATGFGCFEATCILLVLYYLYSANQGADNTTQGYILAATGFKRFSYGELKKVTHGFSEEIGRGAGGIVYKGTLADGRVAAIKRLNEANQGKSPTGTLSFDHGGLTAHGRLVTWVKEKMNKAAAATRDHSWVEEIFDPSLGCDYDINKMEVLVRVALLCLEEHKDSRPTMRQVVEMLASLQ